MCSHREFGPFCVFSSTHPLYLASRAPFRCCFVPVSGGFGAASAWRSLATLRAVVILDRAELARVLGTEVPEGAERGVRGVAYDSRRVEPGFAFVAVPGFKRDGAEFVPEALRRGASLVVAEREVPGAPTAVVPDAGAALAALACAVSGDPSAGMQVYGVTGAERRPAVRTTPEAVEVQETLAEMRGGGVDRVVMEVSSHGIALGRVAGTRFAGALFTNLTRDHLDLHG